MLILNDVSYTSAFYQPIYITAYIGSVSRSKSTVLHPAFKEEVFRLERETYEEEEYEQESKKITLDPKNYIEAIQYDASLVFTPKDLIFQDQKFIRVSCKKYLCAEDEILQQLHEMTRKPKFFVCVSAIIEELGYNNRIVSNAGQFYLSDIRIKEEHKQLEELDLA